MAPSSSVHALPNAPREFGFWLDGHSVSAGDREVNTRISPGHDVDVTQILDVHLRMSTRQSPQQRQPLMTGGGQAFLGRIGLVLLKAAGLIRERMEDIVYWEVLSQ